MISFAYTLFIIDVHTVNINDIFRKLNISSQEATVLTALFKLGDSSVTQLSRETEINRTTLYRILNRLKSEGYCIQKPKLNSSTYSPIDVAYLVKRIESAKEELKVALESLPLEIKNLQSTSDSQRTFKTTVYEGKKECQQLLWNSLIANTTILSFGYGTIKDAVGIKFLTEWFNESFRRNQKHKMIANPGTYQDKHSTADTSKFNFLPEITGNTKFFEKRELSKKIITIPFETFIYENTYSILQWQNNQVLGYEIVNTKIAETERQIFWHLWKSTTTYKPQKNSSW